MRSSRSGKRSPGYAGFYAVTAFLLATLTLGCREDADSPTEPETSSPAFASGTAGPLAFLQVSAGAAHSCGVTTAHRAYCWGLNLGALGTGSFIGPQFCFDDASCSTRPVAVVGGLSFRSVTTGAYYTCGVTTASKAYCWGINWSGQLGDGTTRDRAAPVPVAGGIAFRMLEAGDNSTCGLSTANKVYCWGLNSSGQVGDGTTTTRLRPVRVAGDRAYRQVSAGGDHACAISTADQAFCWGWNELGQLGVGSTVARRLRPAPVAGTRQWRQLAAGTFHTCAVTSDSRTFCWGSGERGQVGDGTTRLRYAPRAVAGTLTFDRVAAGRFHTCAETTGNRVYCWGSNFSGQLGIGTTGAESCPDGFECSTRPRAVQGGLFFTQASAGSGNHTCARTSAGAAYCWGSNEEGQIGNGDQGPADIPTAVVGPS